MRLASVVVDSPLFDNHPQMAFVEREVRKNFIRAARAGLVTCDPGRSMSSSVSFLAVVHCLRTLSLVAVDLIRLVALAARPRAALVAENLFLRKQLALFQERKVRPRRADAATRWMLAA